MNYVVAVDLGGTQIKSALVDADLNIIASNLTATPSQDFDGKKTIQKIAQIVNKFGELQNIQAVGLALPGALDEPSGITRWSGNLQWENLPIRDLLQKEIEIPVAFGHDARTAALAELRNGVAQGMTNALYIPLGTGISTALIVDGVIRSADGYSGEIGHINVNGKYKCVCGKFGCLEATASTLAISKAYEFKGGNSGTSSKDIYQLMMNGDLIASEVWSEAMLALAKGCETLITILAPEMIVFGGGLSIAGNFLLEPIQNYLDKNLTFQRMPLLKIAHYGTKAGIIGCAIIALNLAKDQ